MGTSTEEPDKTDRKSPKGKKKKENSYSLEESNLVIDKNFKETLDISSSKEKMTPNKKLTQKKKKTKDLEKTIEADERVHEIKVSSVTPKKKKTSNLKPGTKVLDVDVNMEPSKEDDLVAEDSESEDEPPEDIPLNVGKEKMQNILGKQKEALDVMKKKKKEQQHLREQRNKEQKVRKQRKRKGTELNEDSSSFIPEKLEDGVLDILASNSTELIPSTEETAEPKPKKKRKKLTVTFNDNESNNRSTKIVAKCINSVSKKDIAKNATEFLKEHFFGTRLKRQKRTLVQMRKATSDRPNQFHDLPPEEITVLKKELLHAQQEYNDIRSRKFRYSGY